MDEALGCFFSAGSTGGKSGRRDGDVKEVVDSWLGRWICNPEVLGSNPPS